MSAFVDLKIRLDILKEELDQEMMDGNSIANAQKLNAEIVEIEVQLLSINKDALYS